MPFPASRIRTAAVASLAGVLAAAAGAWALVGDEPSRPKLGLLTTLPIYWGETFDIGEAIDSPASSHWARVVLEEDYRLVPLDTLADGSPPLGEIDYLLLAQPRALAPAENVALDDWVRAGGRVVIFADPMLTGPTRFSIGDRRRPQDVVLLSPILRHWGLELMFDPDQPDGERTVALADTTMPLALAGSLTEAPASAPSDCTIAADGIVAECRIGEGYAMVIADAALLDQDRDESAAREALEAIVGRVFGG